MNMAVKEPFATGKRPFATERGAKAADEKPGLFPMPLCPVCGSRGVIENVKPTLSIARYSARCCSCGYRYGFYRTKKSLTLSRFRGEGGTERR